MALTVAQESIILEFLQETGKSISEITPIIRRDLEKLFPHLLEDIDKLNSIPVIVSDNNICLSNVIRYGVLSKATLCKPERKIVREFVDWLGAKHNVLIPENEDAVKAKELELRLLRKQARERVPLDARIIDLEAELNDLQTRYQRVILEYNLLKLQLRSYKKRMQEDDDDDNNNKNLLEFTPPKKS